MEVDKQRDQKEPWLPGVRSQESAQARALPSTVKASGTFRLFSGAPPTAAVRENLLHPRRPRTHLLLGCRLDWSGHRHLDVLSPQGPDPLIQSCHQPPTSRVQNPLLGLGAGLPASQERLGPWILGRLMESARVEGDPDSGLHQEGLLLTQLLHSYVWGRMGVGLKTLTALGDAEISVS